MYLEKTLQVMNYECGREDGLPGEDHHINKCIKGDLTYLNYF